MYYRIKSFFKTGTFLEQEQNWNKKIGYRNSKKAHANFVGNRRVKGKQIILDLYVFLHTAIASEEGAGMFHLQPKVPITKVETICNKIIGIFKRANATLVVCIDGKYLSIKATENIKRSETRRSAQEQVSDILSRPNPGQHVEEMKKAMKKATYVRPGIIAQAIAIFKEQNIEVHGAPYEANYQLWHWEKVGFTHGSITVDSDIFAMGDKDADSLFIDLFKPESSKVSCNITVCKEAWRKDMFGNNSSNWSHNDFLIFYAIFGCDYTESLSLWRDI